MIGKEKKFFEENTPNTFIFANSDKVTIMKRVQDITVRLSNINRLQDSKGSYQNSTLRMLSDIESEKIKDGNLDKVEGNGEESGRYPGSAAVGEGYIYSTPTPESSINSSIEVPPPPSSDESIEQSSNTTPDVLEPQGEDKPEEPTWIGCKHDFQLVDEENGQIWKCSECGESA